MPSCASIIEFFVHVSGEAIAATIGAFFGAGAAFLLQYSNEKKLREDTQYAAIIQAQHALFYMWRILASMKLSYLDLNRNTAGRHRKMAFYWKIDRYEKIKPSSIAFMYSKGRRTYLANCFFAERSYLNALDAVDHRNKALEIMVEGAVAVANSEIGEVAVKDAPGSPKDIILEKSTDALFITTDRALKLLAMAFKDLRDSAKAAMPSREFLKDDNLTEEFLRKEAPALGITIPKETTP